MKTKAFLLTALMALSTIGASAQHYQKSRYFNRNTGRLDYSQRGGSYGYRGSSYGYGGENIYYGFRIGPSLSNLSTDGFSGSSSVYAPLSDSKSKAGLNVGIVTGMGLSRYAPIYLETGLFFTQKGAKTNGRGYDRTYNLDYLTLPVTLKLIAGTRDVSIQPFVGGYVAVGTGGKVKDYGRETISNAFGTGDLKRFDAGLKMGCGIGVDVFYAEVAYDMGLANISKGFETVKNSAFEFNVGVNF